MLANLINRQYFEHPATTMNTFSENHMTEASNRADIVYLQDVVKWGEYNLPEGSHNPRSVAPYVLENGEGDRLQWQTPFLEH